MANTQFATSSNFNVLNWERRLERETLKRMQFSKWASRGASSLIRVVDDLARGNKGTGDTVYTTLLMNLTGDGISGDNTLQGNEEALTLYRQTVVIDQLRHGVKSDGRITNQRVFFDFQDEATEVLSRWMSNRMDTLCANVLAGNTTQTNTKYTGMQSASAPTSASGNMRIIYGPGSNTTEASLSASAGLAFQLTMLDDAVAIAETATPYIEPVDTEMGPRYIAVLHPFQIKSLVKDATAGRVTWYDYNKAILQGGGKDGIKAAHYNALGDYNGVLIFSDHRMPLAGTTTRVRRAFFGGAQAATLAFGREGGSLTRFKFDYQEEDYKNRLGIGARVMGGVKKNVYNSIDFGGIVLSSFAA